MPQPTRPSLNGVRAWARMRKGSCRSFGRPARGEAAWSPTSGMPPPRMCGLNPGRRLWFGCGIPAAAGDPTLPTPRPTKVLLVYPRFATGAFWNFQAACELFGAKYPTAPLGLITIAAMLPSSWTVRLIDRNTEDLKDADLDWADLVMTGGMIP